MDIICIYVYTYKTYIHYMYNIMYTYIRKYILYGYLKGGLYKMYLRKYQKNSKITMKYRRIH